jgi:dolichyl-phosphate beta-glucosyltransferase
LFAPALIDDFGFDAEIMYLARKFNYRVRELGVIWRHKDDSRVNPLLAPLSMMKEVFEVRLNDIRGMYDADGSLDR